ncbi:FAD-binding oxidoreductase [Oryzihumus leptocrescens]|uniref:Glycolate oxidase FAD binding subunit n=1 Tax=Oryzihumus leptocrescens TaxID=297536 RepID=A0A542Z855_9MICO|nr:FAD-binding oxidoreductase [Oryzihumus leptocrescens]TQL56504.1 glycolate oxidase FAD binding subunit [Oryzihumus leptocrescens]
MGDVVLQELRLATDDHAAAAGPADTVDGMPARWVASPGSTAETSAVMRVAAVHDLAVVVRGAGNRLTWGAPPERCDLLVDSTRMDAVVEHASGDLVVVVQAGCRLDVLQQRLAGAGQWLAVDPPRPGTVGGTVAAALSGPTRLAHGAVRDLVIGMTMVRADGVVAHSGGKVVKNVAGYDVGKLLTGSYGTLGVITEVAFRLHPLPKARSWVSLPRHSAAAVHEALQRVVHSQLVPGAVELDRAADGSATLTVQLEGVAPGVLARTAAALELLGPSATAGSRPPGWWGIQPAGTGEVLLKVTHELAGLPHLLTALDAAAARHRLAAHVRGSVAVGSVLVGLRAAEGGNRVGPAALGPDEVAGLVADLRQRAASFGGSVVVLDGPRVVKESLDVWGPVGAIDLMRSVKHRFDPARLLAPGRFVGGI